ncbi:multiple myeloma tumor-associated, putative [Ichthyophthirius multifiliis]|uniref:Multiple myeloma tumor-associated, putative n=1 Tax=Ichthyophthirius multifiliis TaxID=5932 RepID=G0R642_ICHMU|nr:multiple myeloma tumor-associated, putative [Ichthyophthirius multifiliis]EGR27065.1 multiple myeloma tumor-associated, putative [Ichthyophthirius multifiliis]|eukprot:XP_004023949.1 multiple myeloma tumor-associated, putative [Ichthyophthirius multifiliis]
MSYLSYEIRDGVRGGRDQFKWDNVRQMTHKDREQYLGQTLKIGFLDKGGKWRKKDWYLKSKGQQQNEIDEIQSQDQKRIRIALGLEKEDKNKILTEQEQKELLNQINFGVKNSQNLEGQDDEEENEQQGIGFKTNVADLQQKKFDINRFLNYDPTKLEAVNLEDDKQKKEKVEKVEKKKKIKKEKKSKKQKKKSKKSKNDKKKHNKKNKKRHDSSNSNSDED